MPTPDLIDKFLIKEIIKSDEEKEVSTRWGLAKKFVELKNKNKIIDSKTKERQIEQTFKLFKYRLESYCKSGIFQKTRMNGDYTYDLIKTEVGVKKILIGKSKKEALWFLITTKNS
jgi:hypothetical protein